MTFLSYPMVLKILKIAESARLPKTAMSPTMSSTTIVGALSAKLATIIPNRSTKIGPRSLPV